MSLLQYSNIYNLGFGDWNEEEKKIDDFVVSNNKDAERVLATVAHAVIDFTDHYPDVIVYAEGSTTARTRRYQMGINKYWHEIEPIFDVLGLVENEGFQQFEKGHNYKAFAVRRKNSNFTEQKREVSMSSNIKKNDKKIGSGKVVVSRNVRDYSKEPFFVKKAEAAKKIIDQYGLPKNFVAGKK